MALYAGIMYPVGSLLLPVANSLHLELLSWSSQFQQEHPKFLGFFNFISLLVLIFIEILPFILLVILSIAIFVGCILLVNKVLKYLGFNLSNDQE